MGTWRFAVSRSLGERSGEYVWEIRELYPSGNGEFGCTERSVAPSGESFDELVSDLGHMQADADREILDLDSDAGTTVHR